MINPNMLILDIETYPNYFLICVYDINEDKYHYFNLKDFSEFIYLIQDSTVIGYNNTEFDNILIKAIIQFELTTEKDIYKFAMELISDKSVGKKLKYRENFDYCNEKFTFPPSLDVMVLNQDCRYTSLKEMAIRINHYKIQELPFMGKVLNDEQKELVNSYCKNDVDITLELFKLSFDELKIRKLLNEMYNVETFNLSRVQAAETTLLNLYSRISLINVNDIKKLRTYNNRIPLDKVLLPMQFNNMEFDLLYEEMKRVILLTETKEFNNEICEKIINSDEAKLSIDVKNIKLNFGIGGLHSESLYSLYQPNDNYSIVDFDCTSYYPNLINEYGFVPKHFTKQTFLNLYKDIIKKRIEYKKEGKKPEAEVMKLMLNSVFGKMGADYSFMHDLFAFCCITLNGQFFILNILDTIYDLDFEVIQVNTDGFTLYINNNSISEAVRRLETWQKQNKIGIEQTNYKLYAQQDISNYFAIDVNDKIKSKGFYSTTSIDGKNDAIVIPLAVIEYYKNGTPIQTYIQNNNNIFNYMYYFKASKEYELYLQPNKVKQQNINRWYISINKGTTLEKIKVEKGKEKVWKVPNSEGLQILNDVETDEIPKDLDKQFYIIEAEKIINHFNNDKVAAYFQSKGLPVMPVNDKKVLINTHLDKIRTDWHYQDGDGLGLYTGVVSGLICIDIDNVELFNTKKHFFNLPDTFTIFRDNEDRRKLIYSYVNPEIQAIPKKHRAYLVATYGLEVLYGSAMAQVSGHHTSGFQYKHKGTIVEIPKDTIEKLLKNVRFTKPRESHEDNQYSLFGKDDKDTEIEEKMYSLIHQISDLNSWHGYFSKRKYKAALIGNCPFEHTHTRVSKRTDFNVNVNDEDNIFFVCHHSSCDSEMKDLNKQIYKIQHPTIIVESKNPIIKKELKLDIPSLLQKTYNTIIELFNLPIPTKIITASTGAGKTHNSALYILNKALKENRKCMYVACNKTDLHQFSELCLKIVNDGEEIKKTLNDIKFKELYSDSEGEEITDKETKANVKQEINDDTLCVITHHTYLKRKGISHYYFSILKWIKEQHPIIILDEVDLYCENIAITIEVESRVRSKRIIGTKEFIYDKINKCRGFVGGKMCRTPSQCEKVNSCEVVLKHEIPEFEQRTHYDKAYYTNQLNGYDKTKAEKDINIYDLNVVINTFFPQYMDFPESNLQIAELTSKENVINYLKQSKEFKVQYEWKKQKETPENWEEQVKELISCSYFPKVYNYLPCYEGKLIKQEYIQDKANDAIWDNREKMLVPFYPCDCKILALKDMSVLFYLQKYASELIFLTATLSKQNQEFINAATCQDVPVLKVENPVIKLNKLLIIGIQKSIKKLHKHQVFLPTIDAKSVMFRPVKREVQETYKNFPTDYPVAYFDTDGYTLKQKVSDCWKVLITHSRGTLGRAINLPMYYFCIVDTRIYKPSFAYELKQDNFEKIKEYQLENRITTAIQNGGRILRKSTEEMNNGKKIYKAIIFEYVEKEELQKFVDSFQPLIENPIDVQFYDQNTLQNDKKFVITKGIYKIVGNYITTGELTEKILSKEEIEAKIIELKNNNLTNSKEYKELQKLRKEK
jgi:hypothetical protein